MTHYSEFKLAAIQAAPVYFDREESTKKACRLIEEAGSNGATLAAFGETWLPGYPSFIIVTSAGRRPWRAAAEYLANAVEVPSATTDQLCESAKRGNVDVVIGIVERDSRTQGTVYCTLLFISNTGEILGRHRKLKPSYKERAIWGEGDGSGLRTYDRGYARISGLNCWEHNMVLPGYVLMSEGTQIHVAAWPGSEGKAPPAPIPFWERQLLLSRAFASQAGAYVILAGGLCSPEDAPEEYRDWAFPATGDSCIIDPRGEVIVGPAEGETILYAEGTLENVFAAKVACDVGGHYSRPDIFELQVNRTIPRRVVDTQPIESPLSESDKEESNESTL